MNTNNKPQKHDCVKLSGLSPERFDTALKELIRKGLIIHASVKRY
jgi:hypothetical protein